MMLLRLLPLAGLALVACRGPGAKPPAAPASPAAVAAPAAPAVPPHPAVQPRPSGKPEIRYYEISAA